MAVMHSLVFCSSYKYIKSLLTTWFLGSSSIIQNRREFFYISTSRRSKQHLNTTLNGEFTAATRDLKVTSFTSGVPPPQQWHRGKQTPVLCVSDTSGLVINYSPGLGATATSFRTTVWIWIRPATGTAPPAALRPKRKCISANCGCTQCSQRPPTGTRKPQSRGCGSPGSGESWRGRMPLGQICGCWTCDLP